MGPGAVAVAAVAAAVQWRRRGLAQSVGCQVLIHSSTPAASCWQCRRLTTFCMPSTRKQRRKRRYSSGCPRLSCPAVRLQTPHSGPKTLKGNVFQLFLVVYPACAPRDAVSKRFRGKVCWVTGWQRLTSNGRPLDRPHTAPWCVATLYQQSSRIPDLIDFEWQFGQPCCGEGHAAVQLVI